MRPSGFRNKRNGATRDQAAAYLSSCRELRHLKPLGLMDDFLKTFVWRDGRILWQQRVSPYFAYVYKTDQISTEWGTSRECAEEIIGALFHKTREQYAESHYDPKKHGISCVLCGHVMFDGIFPIHNARDISGATKFAMLDFDLWKKASLPEPFCRDCSKKFWRFVGFSNAGRDAGFLFRRRFEGNPAIAESLASSFLTHSIQKLRKEIA